MSRKKKKSAGRSRGGFASLPGLPKGVSAMSLAGGVAAAAGVPIIITKVAEKMAVSNPNHFLSKPNNRAFATIAIGAVGGALLSKVNRPAAATFATTAIAVGIGQLISNMIAAQQPGVSGYGSDYALAGYSDSLGDYDAGMGEDDSLAGYSAD